MSNKYFGKLHVLSSGNSCRCWKINNLKRRGTECDFGVQQIPVCFRPLFNPKHCSNKQQMTTFYKMMNQCYKCLVEGKRVVTIKCPCAHCVPVYLEIRGGLILFPHTVFTLRNFALPRNDCQGSFDLWLRI